MNILENQQLVEPVDGIYIDLEAQILQNIARHLQGWEQPIDTDRWLMQKLAEIGKLNQENIRLIAKMSGLSRTAAERMLNAAAEDAIKSLDPGLRYLAERGLAETAVKANKSKNVKQVVRDFRKQAKDTLNMCNTNMLYKASEKYKGLVGNIAQEAWNILNSGAAGVVSGVEARQQAVRRCIRQLNDKGIPAFVDKRGREWTPEAYVNMAMRNTAKSTAEEVQDARIRDAGCHLIQIDSHSGARPKCAKDHSSNIELNEDGSVKLNILDCQNGVNHLICLGAGELEQRQQVDLYAWPDGSIRKEQYYTGIDLIEQYYENTTVDTLAELEEEGRDKFEELKNYKQLKISVDDTDLELGDVIGGRERITNIYMAAPVIRKIVDVTGKGRTSISYKLKGEE